MIFTRKTLEKERVTLKDWNWWKTCGKKELQKAIEENVRRGIEGLRNPKNEFVKRNLREWG